MLSSLYPVKCFRYRL